VIRVYNDAGNVLETHEEHGGEFQRVLKKFGRPSPKGNKRIAAL
jgi:hypothetical protein